MTDSYNELPLGTTAAEVANNTVAIQQAMTVLSAMNLWAYLNPYSGCAPNGYTFHYIIVGGGTSGCVLANRLSEDPAVSVLLIEAGENFQQDSTLASMLLLTKGSRMDWNFTVEHDSKKKQPLNNVFALAGKVLGGTSSVDLMQYSQGFSSDYDEWAKLTEEPAWKFENVLKLFKKLERFKDRKIADSPDKVYHGFSGQVCLVKDRGYALKKYLKAFEEIGHEIVADLNNGTRTGYTGAVFYVDGMRQNSAYTHLYPIRHRPNLIVMKGMQVVKIIFDKNKKAIGVEAVETKTNTPYTFTTKYEVIVAAGTYNTAKLLQLSGVGPKKILKSFEIECISDLPVGDNFHSHVAVPFVFATVNTSRVFLSENFNPNKFPAHTLEGFVALNKSHLNPDYRTITYVVPFTPATLLIQYTAAFYRYDDNVVNYWYNQVNKKEAMFTFLDLLKPKSRGSVRIRSKNPFDTPIIKGNYLSEKLDMDNSIRSLKDFLKLAKSDYFRKIEGFFVDPMTEKCRKCKFHSDDYWRCYIKNLMTPRPHPCGTAAMGSVVDGRLRVYGVHGLRVADASIMPTIISGSTTIATMMIGENAANMIKQDNENTSANLL